MPLDDLQDGELIGRVAVGDVEAFAVLFRRRQGQVYRFALHMTASPAVAEDVTQDVFLAVMSDAGRYDVTRASVVAWLCGIARNHVRRRAERDRLLQPLGDVEDEAETEDRMFAGADDVLGALTRAESIEAVRDAVLTLPIAYREAIVLCDLQELSYVDAAAALGCAVGTVRSRLHRGRALLAAKLSASAGVERDNSRSRQPSGSTRAITRVPNRSMQSVRTVG
jgi:RNA polymerase sigma-70 factor, ECF subfamily